MLLKLTLMLAIAVTLHAQGMTLGAAELGLQGPQNQPLPEVRPEDRCTVEGSVVNAKTGTPIKKANVTLHGRSGSGPGSSFGAMTDAQGKFKIAEIDPGEYMVSIQRTGFIPMNPAQSRGGQSPVSLTLAPRQTVKDITYKLVPGAVVTGRVLDEDGEPLAHVGVQLVRFRYMQGSRRPMPQGMGMTDDLGQYRMHSLPPGRYYVSATYSDQRTMGNFGGVGGGGSSADQGYAPMYYPSALELSQATPIQLREGEERRGIDFMMNPVRTVRIRGRVLSASGEPAKDISVMLMPRAGFSFGGRGARVNNRNGEFEIRGVTPGSYYVSTMNQMDGNLVSARRAVDVGNANVEGVELTLKPGTELKGSIRLETPDPKIVMSDIRVSLMPTEMVPRFGGFGQGTANSDGSFTLKNVQEGDYQVAIYPTPAGYYVKAVRFGDTDALEKGLALTGSSSSNEVEIVLSPNAANIEGSVTDDKGKPLPAAAVVIVPEQEKRTRTDLFRQAMSDQYGKFRIRDFPPGKYKLFAWESIEPGAYSDPEFLRANESDGKDVTLAEKDLQTIDLKALPAPAEGQ